MTHTEQVQAVRFVAVSFLDAVKAGGTHGAPVGVMYAAVCGKCTLNQFNQIMGGLERNGNVRRDGDLFHFVRDL